MIHVTEDKNRNVSVSRTAKCNDVPPVSTKYIIQYDSLMGFQFHFVEKDKLLAD